MKNHRNYLILGLALSGIVSIAPLSTGAARSDDPLGVAVSPHVLLLGKVQTGAVKVHTGIPLFLVNPLTLELNGVPVIGFYADDLGQLVAVFDEGDVKSIVAPPSTVMTLTGEYVTGESFSGSDIVGVTEYVGK